MYHKMYCNACERLAHCSLASNGALGACMINKAVSKFTVPRTHTINNNNNNNIEKPRRYG